MQGLLERCQNFFLQACILLCQSTQQHWHQSVFNLIHAHCFLQLRNSMQNFKQLRALRRRQDGFQLWQNLQHVCGCSI